MEISLPEIGLREMEWPLFGSVPAPVEPTAVELENRLDRVRARMEQRGLTHLLVYGDKEHFANLWWLTNFDPRFEEALLVLRLDAAPLLLIGNECQAYIAISPLAKTGSLRTECYQPFSLASQPRDRSRELREILRAEGVNAAARVGCVGWKSYSSDGEMDTPAYLVDAARALAGAVKVRCATDLFIHPGYGLRAQCGATEIALFERNNWKASEAMKRVLMAVRPGMRDSEMLQAAGYDGTPLSCHMTCKTGPHRISLASPREDRAQPGYPWSANIGYWGSNICRAGWVAESEAELPAKAQGYVKEFAAPYFRAMARWLGMMRIGTPGGAIHAMIQELLPFEEFGIFLNPGHLIHGEEWLSSPIYKGSDIPIASGMVMQSDVIPSSGRFGSTRMEDGYAIADAALREELGARFPDCAARCQARRAFLANKMGIDLPGEVLPLSNLCGRMIPFALKPQVTLAPY
ncbi:MAG: hypothetical protein U5J83_03340 [Bryobacterales bacterium]|nr:hypothetical protein [Bryobacterales bacterium]